VSFIKPQWKTAINEDNFISVFSGTQNNSVIASDGNDGAFIAWEDNRNSTTNVYDIYLQKLDKDGYTIFANDGIPICTAEGDQLNPKIVESNDGSAIVFWLDQRTHPTNSVVLYAQKVDANGNILWTADGVPVSEYSSQTPGSVIYFNAVPDGEGGAYAVWQRNYFGYDQIRAQRVDADGNILWGSTGAIITDGARFDKLPQLIRDNQKGGIVIAYKGTVGYSIMAQRVSPNGNLLWNPNGITVTPNGPQNECSITAGDIFSNGGLMAVSWITSGPVYAQLIDTSGIKLWGENGIIVNGIPGAHSFPKIENDFDEKSLSLSQPGSIDTTFGESGIVIYNLPSTYQSGHSVAIQTDGKIVIGGTRWVNQYADSWFLLLRLNTDGTLDNTFGNGGIVAHQVRNDNDDITSITIQPDGKIIAAGSSWYNGNSDVCLVRYNSDGTFDTTFGNSGVVITKLSEGFDAILSIALQSNGKIVAAGSNDDHGFVARYNADGKPDSTFGLGGISPSPHSYFDQFNAVQIKTDGKIIVGGFIFSDGGIIIARYNESGSIDTTFGNGGYAVTQINANDYATCLILQDNGKILVGGGSGPEDFVSDIILLRYDEDGNLDLTFGTNGYTITEIDSSKSFIQSFSLQNDGKIVAGGGAWSTTYDDFALARYTSDGILDTTFGRNGIELTSIDTSGTDRINSIALQNDNKIITTGFSRGSLVVARYEGGSKIIGNYYLSWLDARSGTGNNIYSQKLDNNGEAKWNPNGNFVSDKPVLHASLNTHQLLFNGREFLSVFQGNGGSYAQSISENGSLNWGSDGVQISAIQSPLKVVNSGNTSNQSGAILTFSGLGNPTGTGINVYAKRINPDGSLGVITSLQNENDLQLNSYTLFQNYPNPFNPSTTIQYAISSPQFVTLKVFDLLGREVATLVNEEKPAGTYEIEFNASTLASGIYFYRLQTDGFVGTKKMILLR
jgi:uncharacterized delta-60 repeat protein